MLFTPLQASTEALNATWGLVIAFLIFFMHAGFAMLEAGQVRSKNVANQLTKNLLTWGVGVSVYFVLGFGIAKVASGGAFEPAWIVETGANGDASVYLGWLGSAVFAMTAATIVSGAVAGRAKLRAYITYTIGLSAVIYPVIIGFTWLAGTGLVEDLVGTPFHDFAGGMIVHGMGGIAGLTAAAVLGPRMGRYNDDGSPNVIPGHSMTFAVLGTLMLAFGWYGFNVGTASIYGSSGFQGAILGRVAMTTTVAMAAGAMGAGLVAWAKTGKVDTLYVANGLLAGLVGITAIPDTTAWWGAFLVGGLAGAQLPLVFGFVEKRLKIDDVCAVFPVHGSAGVLGTLMFPFVATDARFTAVVGDASVIESFVAQAVGVVIIGGWTLTATLILWYAFKLVGQARVTADHEREGLDIAEHGVETYPEFGDEGAAVTDGGNLRTDGGISSDDESDDPVIRTDGGEPNDGEIKMVVAMIRPDKLSDVKQALAEVGAPSLTVTNVSGRGSQPAKKGQWRGEEYVVDLHQKVKIECVVADIPAGDVVDAIAEGANTGEPGDGKVFVLPVESARQIRTGETGRDAV